jgi:hypothetical protein
MSSSLLARLDYEEPEFIREIGPLLVRQQTAPSATGGVPRECRIETELEARPKDLSSLVDDAAVSGFMNTPEAQQAGLRFDVEYDSSPSKKRRAHGAQDSYL